MATKMSTYMPSVASLSDMLGSEHMGQLKCLTPFSLMATLKCPLKQNLHSEHVHPGIVKNCTETTRHKFITMAILSYSSSNWFAIFGYTSYSCSLGTPPYLIKLLSDQISITATVKPPIEDLLKRTTSEQWTSCTSLQ